jgi:hypothetical protein
MQLIFDFYINLINFNYFLFLFNRFFKIYIFKLLLMGLLMNLVRLYILESWKRIIETSNDFLFMFNRFFFKIQIITNEVTDGLSPSVYLKELEKNYYKCHCHCLVIDGITDGLFDSYMSNSPKKIPTNKNNHWWNDIRFFYRWYVIFIYRNTNGMKQVKFLFWHAFSISRSIGKIITDKLTDRPQITNESFFNGLFPSMRSSGKFMLTNCEYKYRQKILSLNLKVLVMSVSIMQYSCCVILRD